MQVWDCYASLITLSYSQSYFVFVLFFVVAVCFFTQMHVQLFGEVWLAQYQEFILESIIDNNNLVALLQKNW